MAARLPTHHKLEEKIIPYLEGLLRPTESGLYIGLSERDYEEIGTRITIAAAKLADTREFGKLVVITLLEYLAEVASASGPDK